MGIHKCPPDSEALLSFYINKKKSFQLMVLGLLQRLLCGAVAAVLAKINREQLDRANILF